MLGISMQSGASKSLVNNRRPKRNKTTTKSFESSIDEKKCITDSSKIDLMEKLMMSDRSEDEEPPVQKTKKTFQDPLV